MKFSDGLFHKVFDEIAKEYSDIQNEHWIVDIGAAKLADTPEVFDVIVMPNLYGDILSDVAAQISGSVGLAGSANIGDKGAMFEAIHGSAPRRAGQNVANPSGLLLGSVLMLLHIGQPEIAARIQNAWLCTLEEGIHTYDIFKEGISKEKVGTQEFAHAVVKNLGKTPQHLKAVSYPSEGKVITLAAHIPTSVKRTLVGVDIFIHSKDGAEVFQKSLNKAKIEPLHLKMISNRGVRVWPEGMPETFCIDQYRCRFMHEKKDAPATHQQIIANLQHLLEAGFDVIKTENLYSYDGEPGYSSAQG
jgi:isocitrate dehydrogenase